MLNEYALNFPFILYLFLLLFHTLGSCMMRAHSREDPDRASLGAHTRQLSPWMMKISVNFWCDLFPTCQNQVTFSLAWGEGSGVFAWFQAVSQQLRRSIAKCSSAARPACTGGRKEKGGSNDVKKMEGKWTNRKEINLKRLGFSRHRQQKEIFSISIRMYLISSGGFPFGFDLKYLSRNASFSATLWRAQTSTHTRKGKVEFNMTLLMVTQILVFSFSFFHLFFVFSFPCQYFDVMRMNKKNSLLWRWFSFTFCGSLLPPLPSWWPHSRAILDRKDSHSSKF